MRYFQRAKSIQQMSKFSGDPMYNADNLLISAPISSVTKSGKYWNLTVIFQWFKF
jgi:hypothetical protein